MSNMTIGVQLYSVRQSCQTAGQLAESISKIAAIGYAAVEVGGLGKAVDENEAGKALADSGLIVASAHFSWDRLRSDLDGVIAQLRRWNCTHPVIPNLPAESYSADGLARFIDQLGPVAAKLSAAGMDLSYHNHYHELVRLGSPGGAGQSTWLAMLYERTDGKTLKAELDTFWITTGGGDPAWWIRRCAGRQPLLHLKDMIVLPDRTQRFAEIGEGNLNWPAILDAAAAGGVKYLIVEQDQSYDRDPFESLAISHRNLHAMGMC